LFDITADHSVVQLAGGTDDGDMSDSGTTNDVHITALLCHDGQLWVGTHDG
jgi:hypothetical protein